MDRIHRLPNSDKLTEQEYDDLFAEAVALIDFEVALKIIPDQLQVDEPMLRQRLAWMYGNALEAYLTTDADIFFSTFSGFFMTLFPRGVTIAFSPPGCQNGVIKDPDGGISDIYGAPVRMAPDPNPLDVPPPPVV